MDSQAVPTIMTAVDAALAAGYTDAEQMTLRRMRELWSDRYLNPGDQWDFCEFYAPEGMACIVYTWSDGHKTGWRLHNAARPLWRLNVAPATNTELAQAVTAECESQRDFDLCCTWDCFKPAEPGLAYCADCAAELTAEELAGRY